MKLRSLAAATLALALVLTACPADEPDVAEPEPAPDAEPAPDEEPDEAPDEPAEVVELQLDAASFLPVDHQLVETLYDWVDRVEAATDGQVVIEWGRGPEAIDAFDQLDAVRTGVIDTNFNVTAYYEDQQPALRAFSLSEHTPWEERETGFYELMVELHEPLGVRYLGRWLSEQPFYLWTADPVDSPDDLAGLEMRTAALYDRFMQELGITPITVATPEVYSSLEAGLVQGFGWPILGPVDLGWTEHACCLIDHPFFNQNATILVNLDTWNEIPADLQDTIIEVTAEYERDMAAHFAEVSAAERERLEEAGVEFISFSDEDAEAFVQLALDTEWNWLEQEVPDLVDQLREAAAR